MTYFLNQRSSPNGGATVTDPRPFRYDGPVDASHIPFSVGPSVPDFDNRVAGHNVILGIHGFNVDYADGVRSLSKFETNLRSSGMLLSSDLFLGVLWPGDWWLPAINYPFEGSEAMDTGRRLATFCNSRLKTAQSISFISHSLGARVALEAIQNIGPRVRALCLMAGAINCDCLLAEYKAVPGKVEKMSILASSGDWVLKFAYPFGDFVADMLHDDHCPFMAALGSVGPRAPASENIHRPWDIHAGDFGHGSYLPAAKGNGDAAEQNRWKEAADFAGRTFANASTPWPFPNDSR